MFTPRPHAAHVPSSFPCLSLRQVQNMRKKNKGRALQLGVPTPSEATKTDMVQEQPAAHWTPLVALSRAKAHLCR